MPDIDFGSAILRARIRAGYETQRELAEVAGMNRSHLGRIECNCQLPRWQTLSKIAAACNTTVRALLLAAMGYESLAIKEE